MKTRCGNAGRLTRNCRRVPLTPPTNGTDRFRKLQKAIHAPAPLQQATEERAATEAIEPGGHHPPHRQSLRPDSSTQTSGDRSRSLPGKPRTRVAAPGQPGRPLAAVAHLGGDTAGTPLPAPAAAGLRALRWCLPRAMAPGSSVSPSPTAGQPAQRRIRDSRSTRRAISPQPSGNLGHAA